MNQKQRIQLRKLLNELASIKGRHTELVSVYIPAGYDLLKVINQLEQEKGTASNIKDARTRKNVTDSLEKAIRHLKLYKKTPENGLVIFVGNASTTESKIDIKVWSIEPPEPIKTRLYRCDQTFVIDILREMLEAKDIYGLIVLDAREATIGLLKGSLVQELATLTSGVPGKVKTGGQCLLFSSLVEVNKSLIKIKDIKKGDLLRSYDFKNNEFIFSECVDFWKVKKNETLEIKAGKNKIVTSKDHIFFVKDGGKIKQVAAEDLIESDCLLDSNLKPIKIVSIKPNQKEQELIDISIKNQNFIANGIIVHNSAARYARLREGALKEFFQRIGEAANKNFLEIKELKGIIIGGPVPTKDEFFESQYLNNELKKKVIGLKDLGYTGEFGLQELFDKSQDLLIKEEAAKEKALLTRFFETLGKDRKRVAYGKENVDKVLDIGAVEILILSESLTDKEIEDYEEKASSLGTEVYIVSVESREAKQLKDLGGIAAILRYPVEKI